MSDAAVSRWHDGALDPLEHDVTQSGIVAADSWFVHNGAALALGEHRARFLRSAPAGMIPLTELEGFWNAAIAAIPANGDWFPRVELHDAEGTPGLLLRLRVAPERNRSVVLATWRGTDPRTTPHVKGPDLESLLRVRAEVQQHGADEAVLLTPDGFVVDVATSALLWWRGDILCGPPSSESDAAFARVDSVTSRSLLTLARALGHDTHEEAVTPAELDGTELWAVNALHGIRIVTEWVDGPQLAERPGRLNSWQARLDALRKPIHGQVTPVR